MRWMVPAMDLVALPVRDGADTLALSAQLATAAAHWQKPPQGKARPLPASILSALGDLAETRADLEAVQPKSAPPAPTVRAPS